MYESFLSLQYPRPLFRVPERASKHNTPQRSTPGLGALVFYSNEGLTCALAKQSLLITQ